MRIRFGTILVAAVAVTCAATAAGNGRPEESVECPVSANMRGHENTEWSIYYGYHLTDQNRHLPRVLLVGDSICNGYQRGVAQILEGKMNVSYWVSSYCVTSPGYLKRLALCLDEAFIKLLEENGWEYTYSEDIHRKLDETIIEDDLREYLSRKYSAEALTDDELDAIVSRSNGRRC